MELSQQEIVRYHRQIIYPGFGQEAQKKLKRASVLIVGIGGLGSPVAMYLTSVGVGKIRIIDSDTVELSNLNRQVLHWESDIGVPKVESAGRKIKKANSSIDIDAKKIRLTRENAPVLVNEFDVVMDCLDNRQTRLIINEQCRKNRIPLVHGGVFGVKGQVTTIVPGEGPCLECLFISTKEMEKPFPIIGATAGIIGSIQAMEAIKILTGIGKPLVGEMLFIDCGIMEFRKIRYDRRKSCRVCSRIH